MSLATRCPYCRTTFRVTHDQLKLRGGLVRCGACKEIFNGVEHLLPSPANERYGSRAPSGSPIASPGSAATADQPDRDSSSLPQDERASSAIVGEQAADTATGPTTATRSDQTHEAVPSPGVEEPAAASEAVNTGGAEPLSPADAEDSAHGFEATRQPFTIGRAPDTNADPPDPLTRMTLMDIRPEPESADAMTQPAPPQAGSTRSGEEVDEIGEAIDDLQNRPWRSAAVAGDDDEIDALDNEEPEFVRKARQQQQQEKRLRRILTLGIAVLVLLALLQATLALRSQIAAQWPATMPLLTRLCEPFGCNVPMPAQIEYVTIESHELHAMPASDNTFTLNLLIRNRSNVMQAWPHLQLTLNDPAGEPLLRKVLSPAEYLGTTAGARGITPHSERPVRVSFAVEQLKASGYVVHLFYP